MYIHKLAQLTGHNAAVFALSPGSDSNHFISGAGDGWIVRWHLDSPDTGQLIARVDNQVFSLLHIPEKGLLIAGTMNGGLHWINLTHPEQTLNIAHHQRGVFDLLLLGDYVISAGGEGKLTRWSVASKRAVESIQLSNRSLRSLAFSGSRNEIAVGASDGQIYLLDADTLELRYAVPKAHEPAVFCVRYSPDEQRLYSGGRDAHLRVWNPESPDAYITAIPAHRFTINSVCFHPRGHLFATASRDKTIKIWETASNTLVKVLDTIRFACHINSVNNLLWLPSSELLVSASDDRSIILWEIN
jgi:WD40 repeat protein